MNKNLMMALKTPVPTWSPADITTYFWLDPSDISTLFTDSAGTTAVTAADDPIGRLADKSGNSRHAKQSTSGYRPLYKVDGSIKSFFMDGSDDSLRVSAASGLSTDMDFFIAAKRTSTSTNVFLYGSEANTYAGVVQSGSTVSPDSQAGTPTYYVDGTLVSPKQRGALHTAMGSGAWHVLEIRNVNAYAISNNQTLGWCDYAGYKSSVYIGGIVLANALSSTNRSNLRTWLGAKVGLTL